MWDTASFDATLRSFVAEAVGVPERVERVGHRPWSAVWRVTASGGTSYAKQNCPGQAHEARLLGLLATHAPEYVVPVLAAGPADDLLLTADLGPTLDENGAVDVAVWCGIVAASAALQRRVADVDLGLTVLAPADAATYVADAAGRLSALPPGDPRRLEPATAGRLELLLQRIDDWAEEVDALGLPTTLVHNDLHAGNVVTLDGALRFFDFGDAVAGDPLANLLVPLLAAADALALPPADAGLARIVDAALEVWSDLAPMTELRAALPAALQLARIARVESWRRCVATMLPAEQAEYGGAPAGWLASLLDPPPIPWHGGGVGRVGLEPTTQGL